MKGQKLSRIGAVLVVVLGIGAPTVAAVAPSLTVLASDAPTYDASKPQDGSYEVAYVVNKAGTDKPSLSNSFFTGKATVVVSDSGKNITVTLHLKQFASMVSAFKIGNQAAKVTNATKSTSDLTFKVDDQFKDKTVTASMTVLNMNQKADIVFATPLYQVPKAPSQTVDTGKDTGSDEPDTKAPITTPDTGSGTTTTPPADTSLNTGAGAAITTPPDQGGSSPADTTSPAADKTEEVGYTLNKAGTPDLSLANSFFSGSATVTTAADGQKTVTLHLLKYASLVKAFSIGGQEAKLSNVTKTTEDLTFNVDTSFKTKTVPAAMTVMTMNQKADLVFAKALYQPTTTKPGDSSVTTDGSATTTPATDDSENTTQTDVTKADKTDSDGTKKTGATKPGDDDKTDSTAAAAKAGQVSLKIYKSVNGKLFQQVSAAQAFIADKATVRKIGKTARVTIHTTGAQYINSMTLLGQRGVMTNKHGDEADITFNVPTAALTAALPATFSLTVPGNLKLTEPAFVLVGRGVVGAKVYPGSTAAHKTAPKKTHQTAVKTPKVTRVQHALKADQAVQYLPYTVLNADRSGISMANNYFTHTAKVVRVSNGYDVYLTVQETAGLVDFTPVAVNGSPVFASTKTRVGGDDVWRFAFHIARASQLDDLLSARIQMSVAIAGIHDVPFVIWFEFGRSQTGGVDYETAGGAAGASANAAALPATTIPLTPRRTAQPTAKKTTAKQKTKNKSTASAKQVTSAAKSPDRTPQVHSYPFIAEIAGFAAISLAIIGFAIYKRRHA